MFRTLIRVLLILLVSVAVAGVIYGLVRYGNVDTSFERERSGIRGRSRSGEHFSSSIVRKHSTRNDRRHEIERSSADLPHYGERDGHSEGRFSIVRGVAGILRSLIVISLITALLIGAEKAFSYGNSKPSPGWD